MASYAKFSIKDRNKLKKYIKMKLGYPIVSVEITDEQMDFAIDEACELFSKWVHYDQEYYALDVCNVKPITKENPNGNYCPERGFKLPDNIVSVNAIHQGNTSLLTNQGTTLDFFLLNSGMYPGTGMFNNNNTLPGNGVFLDIFLFQNLIKQCGVDVFGHRYTYNYNERSKFLTLNPDPQKEREGQKVLVLEVQTIRPEEELLGEDIVKRASVALVKQMVGQVRAKFGSGISFPGGGQIGTDILQEGKEEYDAILEELKATEPPFMFFLQN